VIAVGHFEEQEIDLSGAPWSRRGSYMTLSMNTDTRDHPGRDHDIEPGLYLCDVSGYRLWRWNGVFRVLGLVGDDTVQPQVRSATPSLLVLSAGDGTIEVTWDGSDTMRFRVRGVGMRLVQSVIDPLDSALAFPMNDNAWRLLMGEDTHFVATRLGGTLTVDAPRVRTGASDTDDRKVVDFRPDVHGVGEFAVTQYETGYAARAFWLPFDEARAAVALELAGWADGFPRISQDLAPTSDAAAALLWSNTVGPRGILSRPGVLMSKNWMHAIWSWDNCFVSLGVAGGDPQLAWDQFMLPFDLQAPDGMLADVLHDNGRLWGFCKPPVHGWTLRGLLAAGAVPEGGLAEVYPRLVAWTEWWLTYRDDDGDGLVEYSHGNDSGQDNSTAFDATGFPAAGPDLSAFLVVQMDVLAEVATQLGLDEEAARWATRADHQLGLLLSLLWDGEHFVVRRGGDGVSAHAGASQLFLLPLMLGERLPVRVRERVLADVAANLTPYGVASESPESALYEADGYWRGPIWAPTTYLVIDGLRACGQRQLADDIGRRFLDTVRRGGFAENFEATTGRPLRDRGYSWSAAVFLMLARELESEESTP